MQGSEASTLQVGPWSNSWPVLLPLVCSNWQDPRSHWSANIADTVAPAFKSLLPWLYNLQELFGLAIPLEPLAHARLVLTQVDIRECQKYGKSTQVSCHAGGSIGSGTSFEGIVPFSTTKSFLILVPKWEHAYRRGFDSLLRPNTNDTVAMWLLFFFLLRVFVRNSQGHHYDLGIPFSWALTKSPAIVVVRSSQPSLFSNLLRLQPWVLVDQG